MIKILVNGASGRMGRAMSAGILGESDMQIVAAVDIRQVDGDVGVLAGQKPIGVKVENDLVAAIRRSHPDVMLDFTNPQAVLRNIRVAIGEGLPCVVGTTGLSEHDLGELAQLSQINHAPIFIAANFAITAVLMMRFAVEAARYIPQYEIIERHHENKMDAPSGTALRTMEMIGSVREVLVQGAANEMEMIPGSRGGDYQGARVHSMRLPGYVASQE
ncbi:MAG: 4-hydroxy-tetrahydrodipicolinate reductase, partial [Clostridiales bacterium]